MSQPKVEQRVRPDAVAIYVRWSTEEQGEGTTLEEQLERCRNYVLSQGWRVNDHLIFVDDGYSGATLNRPGIIRLRELVQQDRVDCVVSMKIDRLSRSLVDCVDLVLREWQGVCFYKSVSQPVNTTDELGRVFFAILAGFAEYERALIRERTFSGLLRRVREGNFWGSGKAPYGYARVAKGRLAVHDQESQVVRMIFAMAVNDGLGPAAIASQLNGLGVPGPEGKGWWAYTIRAILRNRIYIGCLEYGKRYVDPRARTAGGNHVLRKRERPLVEPEGRCPELILVADGEFEAAQRLLRQLAERAKERGTGARSAHLLTGLARCRCGGSMITGYDALGRRYYFCQNRDRSRGSGGCTTGGGFVYAHQIEPLVGEEVRKRFMDPVVTSEHLRSRWEREREKGGVTAGACRRMLDQVSQRERRLEEDLARIVRQARRGEITIQEKRAFAEDLEAERKELAAQRAALEQRLGEVEGARETFGALLAWVARVDQWDELSADTQKEVLRHLIDHLVVFKAKGRGQTPEVDLYWLA